MAVAEASAHGANAEEPSTAPAFAEGPAHPAELLFVYPPGKSVNVDNIASFCFPHGVKPKLCERTPSLTEINELVYGQGHLHTDHQSFVFLLKVRLVIISPHDCNDLKGRLHTAQQRLVPFGGRLAAYLTGQSDISPSERVRPLVGA